MLVSGSVFPWRVTSDSWISSNHQVETFSGTTSSGRVWSPNNLPSTTMELSRYHWKNRKRMPGNLKKLIKISILPDFLPEHQVSSRCVRSASFFGRTTNSFRSRFPSRHISPGFATRNPQEAPPHFCEIWWSSSDFIFLLHLNFLHPGRLTWNLPITHLERKMIFQTSMIMFHDLWLVKYYNLARMNVLEFVFAKPCTCCPSTFCCYPPEV